jgi:hypothetical protein
MYGLDSGGLAPVICCCKYSNEPLGSIRGGEFLDKLSYYELLNNDSTAWSFVPMCGLTLHRNSSALCN